MNAIERKRASFRRWYDKNRRAKEPRQAPVNVRFARMVMPVPDAGCWLWMGSTDRAGYGQLSAGRAGERPLLAHRLSWELHCGPIPDGMFVCHKCDTPQCCNPDHLFLGTPSDNMRDASRKFRVGGAYRRRLSDADIAEIIATHRPGRGSPTNTARLGERFGVSKVAISHVLRRVAPFPNSPAAEPAAIPVATAGESFLSGAA